MHEINISVGSCGKEEDLRTVVLKQVAIEYYLENLLYMMIHSFWILFLKHQITLEH